MPSSNMPILKFIDCPDAINAKSTHRLAYWDWGKANADHVIFCVHGLTRQGRDFDVLARALCAANPDVRVVCPDVAGRGQSEWLKDPNAYALPTYAADMLVLLNHLKPKVLDWVGTSMGGLIGMVVTGQANLPLPVPVRKLVLNDVGPVLEWVSLVRIGQYLGKYGRFDNEEIAAEALWQIAKGFGPHTSAQWLELTKPSLRPWIDPATGQANGVTLRYDPAIAQPFSLATEESTKQGEAILWALYDNIKAQTLLVRGADSDLLSSATALAMTQRGPKATLVEFAGVGHAPTFVATNQSQVVVDFLLK